jgi:hypothetical protein
VMGSGISRKILQWKWEAGSMKIEIYEEVKKETRLVGR